MPIPIPEKWTRAELVALIKEMVHILLVEDGEVAQQIRDLMTDQARPREERAEAIERAAMAVLRTAPFKDQTPSTEFAASYDALREALDR